jgi:hypothetical protein
MRFFGADVSMYDPHDSFQLGPDQIRSPKLEDWNVGVME